MSLIRFIYRALFRHAHTVDAGKFKAFGHGVEFLPGVVGDPEYISIGDWVYVGPECYMWGRGGITIGDNVIIGPRVTIHTVNHRYDDAELLPYDGGSFLEPVSIGRNVWIGGHVMIVPGVTIGEGAVVAMGAVVTKDVPPCAVVGGNPARVLKFRDEEKYRRLDEAGAYYLRAKAKGGVKHVILSKEGDR